MPHFADSSFPKEILRKIFLQLDWKDRKQLYQTHPNIASSIATTVVYGDCDILAQSEFMRLKLARSVKLTSEHHLFFESIIQSLTIAAHIKTLKIECDVSKNLISLIIKALRRRDAIDILTQEHAADKWKAELSKSKSSNISLCVRMENGLLTRHDSTSPTLHANHLFNFGQYFKDDQQFLEHDYEKFAGTMIDDESVKNSTEVTVNEVTKQFVGCVVDFGFFKVFISSFDTFVHLDDSVDDCANRIVTKDPYIFSKIREKPNYKSSSYEISIYIGSLELLVIGGVVITGNNEGSCFLGSSVKPLIPIMSHGKETVSRDIYVKKTQVEVATSERLLRQYYKIHAAKKWSFHMKSLADMGFCPLNPLRVEEHPLFSANADPALLCQSKIFQAYALRSVDALNLPDVLQKFKASRPLKNQAAKLKSTASFGELKEGLEGDGKWPKVVEALAKLEAGSPDLFTNDRATTVRNKKLLLSFADFGFFSSVAQKNAKIIKATEKLFLK